MATRKRSDGQPASRLKEWAIDAQRIAVQGFNGMIDRRVTAKLALLGMALALASTARAADDGAVVSGVVRDAQGVAQIGALVQVLKPNSTSVATTFTDSHGRYSIVNLDPGRYLVRASATLLVPATRANLQLRAGAVTVVNLTLAALFDTSTWLPAERRRADEPEDDWKWTLRSSANRPILRILDDGSLIEISTSASEASAVDKMRVRATVASGDGEFGGGGVHNILELHRGLDSGGDMIVRSDVAATRSTRVPAPYGPAEEFEAGYEVRQGFAGAARTVVSYKSHPELLVAGSTAGLESFAMISGQRLNVGDLLKVEAGGSMQVVNTTLHGITMHPFVRLTTHPMGVWTLHYRMASDRLVQGFEDVTTGQTEVPVALVKNGKLALAAGRHQEASVDRKVGRGTVSLALYRDAMSRTAISGGGALAPDETLIGQVSAGMMIDPTTGSFRTLAAGYTTQGVRLTASTPLIDGLWVAAEFSSGDAMASETGPMSAFVEALAGLKAEQGQSATLALKSKLKGSGTRIRASYRWQPAKLVTAVDPYSAFSEQPFVSCQFRQPIRWGTRLPKGLDATIDVTNLLAQGYRPFVSADGLTLYFAQAPRTIQGGLSFSF